MSMPMVKLNPDHGADAPTGRTGPRHGEATGPEAEGPGSGLVHLDRIADRTVVTRLRTRSPLKVLVPRQRERAAWMIQGNFGGGLLEGDRIDLTLAVGPGAIGYVGTQGSTKIFRSEKNLGATQQMSASVADRALLVVAPDPVACYAGAIYDQVQRFDLTGTGSLFLIDWVTAGRIACAERWALDRYHGRNDIFLDGDHLYGDATLLDGTFGPVDAPFRTGRYNCLATLVLAGAQVDGLQRRFVEQAQALPVGSREPLIHSASAFEGGAVIRVAGVHTAQVTAFLHDKLRHVADRLGEDPWARKF
jgi:urease accessory protein